MKGDIDYVFQNTKTQMLATVTDSSSHISVTEYFNICYVRTVTLICKHGSDSAHVYKQTIKLLHKPVARVLNANVSHNPATLI